MPGAPLPLFAEPFYVVRVTGSAYRCDVCFVKMSHFARLFATGVCLPPSCYCVVLTRIPCHESEGSAFLVLKDLVAFVICEPVL